MQVKILNEISVDTEEISIEQLHRMQKTGELVILSNLLQRPLLDKKWTGRNFSKAKEYIVSIFKNSSKLDSFSIIPCDVVSRTLQNKLNEESDKDSKKAYKLALKIINELIEEKAEYICLDGQSRLFLSIIKYIDGEFKLNELKGISLPALEIDGERSDILQTKLFTELPPDVRDFFFEKVHTIHTVTSAPTLKDVINALITKNKSESWVWFQMGFQQNRFSKFVIDLVKSTTSLFEKTWETKITDNRLLAEVNGHHLFLSNTYYYIKNGLWPNKSQISDLLTSDTSKSVDSITKKVQEYFKELSDVCDSKQLTHPFMINYVLLRAKMDGYKNISLDHLTIPKSYNIKDTKSFVNNFWQIHTTISGTPKKPHEASYISINGKWEKNNIGYKHLCTSQNTDSINARMVILLNYIDWNSLLLDNTINESNGNSKISKNDVLIHNDFKDLCGKRIPAWKSKKTDISHKKSQKNSPELANDLDNTLLEAKSPNRARGSRDITKYETDKV
jgi:hypothetical protein